MAASAEKTYTEEKKKTHEVWKIFGKNTSICEELYNMTDAEAREEARRMLIRYCESGMPEFYCVTLRNLDGHVLSEYNECPDDWRCADCGKDTAQANFALDDPEYCVECHDTK